MTPKNASRDAEVMHVRVATRFAQANDTIKSATPPPPLEKLNSTNITVFILREKGRDGKTPYSPSWHEVNDR